VSSYLNLGKDIKTCQANGVKVIVSLGGDKVSDYKFSPGDGKRYAQLFYDMFLEGTHPVRPFGPGVVLDGIELDIEKNPAYPGPSPWTPEMIDMINTLRTLSPKTTLAIVPQCYLKDLNYNGSDQNVGAVIPAVADKIDYLIVQYYNNPTVSDKDHYACSYPFNFNYYEWTKLFKGKIVVGLAGDWTSAISGGFLEPGPLQAVYDEIKSDPQFYGFSVYDVSSSTPPALSKSPATYTNPPPTTYSKTLKDVLSGVTVGSGFPSQAQLGITTDKQYSKRCGGTWVNANQTCSNKACTSNADCGKFEQCFDYMRNSQEKALVPLIHAFLVKAGASKAAEQVKKDLGLKSSASPSMPTLLEIYKVYQKHEGLSKLKLTSPPQLQHRNQDSDDSDDEDEEMEVDEKPTKAAAKASDRDDEDSSDSDEDEVEPPKAKAAAKKSDSDSDSDSDDSDDSEDSDESEDEKPQVAKPAAKKASAAKKQDSDSDDSDDSDESEKPAPKKAAAAVAKKAESDSDDSDSSDSDEDETPKVAVKSSKKKEESDSDSDDEAEDSDSDSSSDSDDEDEKPAAAPKKSIPAKKAADSDDSDDSSDEEDKKPVAKKAAASKAKAKDESDDDSDDESSSDDEAAEDSDDESSDDEKPAPKKAAAKKEESDDSSDDDEDESEEEEEKMKVHQPTGSKRKADDADLNPPSKKSKDLSGKAAAVQSKTPERFQRIKAEEVTFKDDRLKDNRFEAKGGAISSYGMKAHQDLIVTRGKGFTAEKNKKKRGSYRGGSIDQESYSIKFNYSDDE
ncbi:hypothetical protein HDU77_006568, partial [Chytriomyces hyalinus]